MFMLFSKDDIAMIRESCGVNLREFGELLGVSEATVSRWETGHRQPSVNAMKKLNELAVKKKLIPSVELSIRHINGHSRKPAAAR